MAAGLAVSQERQERIAKLKRFLAPQVAELVDRKGDDGLLEGHRTQGSGGPLCELRGFTAFSAKVAPEEASERARSTMRHSAGSSPSTATSTRLEGDGLMVLVNAPVAVEEQQRCGP